MSFKSRWCCPTSRSAKGLTVPEVLVALVIVSLLVLIAVPPLHDFLRGVESRKAAREVASILRLGRARAIATNYEHRVEFDHTNKRYRLIQGNRASGSQIWNVVIKDWTRPEGVTIDFDANIFSIHFNTNGSSNHGTITVRENMRERVYKVIISRTGRVRIS